MFRIIFETEASPPERGISKPYVLFMMGHSSADRVVTKLDMPGGTYDNTPKVYLDVVEREYEKLEPYINIYTGRAAGTQGLSISQEDMEYLKLLLEKWKQGKVRVD